MSQDKNRSLNDYGFVIERINLAKKVVDALEMWSVTIKCKFYYLDDEAYEEYCRNEKSKPNKKKFPYDFKPERDCVRCPYYVKR